MWAEISKNFVGLTNCWMLCGFWSFVLRFIPIFFSSLFVVRVQSVSGREGGREGVGKEGRIKSNNSMTELEVEKGNV